MKTTINGPYLRDIVWTLKLSLHELNERAGLSAGYIYRLTDDENQERSDFMVSTVDRLHDAIEARMVELGINPPDDLWMRLLRQSEAG
jgi:hypothetical protein